MSDEFKICVGGRGCGKMNSYWEEKCKELEKENKDLKTKLSNLYEEKHGEWKESCPTVSDGELYKSWVCSKCNYRVLTRPNYCCNCGSRNRL